MRGTLAEGDCLWVTPIPAEKLQVGDVVAFHSGGSVLAHRIVGRREMAFLTQGDGNWRRDSAALDPGRLIGRVTARERRGNCRNVAGGARGRRRAAFLHGFAFTRWLVLNALAPFYRHLRASGVCRRIWRPRITIVHYRSSDGSITKYIHHGRTVASWVVHEQRWTCRKPYDLVLRPPVP